MKISNEVIYKYTQLCKTSTAKCESFFDIEYKIYRHINLGKLIEIKDKGDTIIVRYYDLDFTITKNKVVNLERDRNKELVWIKEENKIKYDRIHMKLVV